ncbi:hypothetical protein ALC62_14354 [Cyphomyrmex costatus]|uniref:CCHC-type domain-containing protein n=1 Tax=Cyphomyrmex costatus TaxID=456900 RepID=A0A151I8M1_9HYME|nr:hypothetical protein ALC62_14354 [Cyphomyrmex costatus]
MDPNVLTVAQLKWTLKQQKMPVYGRKVELIQRLQVADPSGEWIKEAVQQITGDDEEELMQLMAPSAREEEQTENAWGGSQSPNDSLREAELARREKELLQREIELLRRENEMLRGPPNNSTVTTNVRATTSVKSISELVGEYKGSDEDFKRWRRQIDLLRATYELDENASKILIGSKLRGKALDWYHSRADHIAMTADDLLKEMQTMFERPRGRLELRKTFESRQWQKGELFSEYCHHKQILGNRVPIDKEEMVDYVIEGIPSEVLRNQARMHRFTSVQDVTQAFNKISLKVEPESTLREKHVNKGVTKKQGSGGFSEKKDESTATAPRVSSRGAIKCYECNNMGHYAKDCPSRKLKDRKTTKEKKTEAGSKSVGLLEEERSGDSSAGEDQSEESHSEQEDICFVDLKEEVRDEFQRTVKLEVEDKQQYEGTARMDTGCPVSLIKNSCVDDGSVKRAGDEWNRYCGINKSRLRVLGVVAANLRIGEDHCKVTVGVVPDETMSTPLLVGRDALKSLGYSLTKNPQYDKVVTELFSIETVRHDSVDRIQINENISQSSRDQLKTLYINHYVAPTRPKEPKVYFEANIQVKNDQPVQFGPRRLGYADKEKVQEILTSLLEREIIRPSTSEFFVANSADEKKEW